MESVTEPRTLWVSEIFYSLQGEGGRAGEPSIFIRLRGCSARFACYALGVRCDTEFESGVEYSLEDLVKKIEGLNGECSWIVWTGGEPTDQLDEEIVKYFQSRGYQQAIETSGLHPVPRSIDYICVSPKVAEHVVEKNFPHLRTAEGNHVHELRYVRHAGQGIPDPSISADFHYLSPHFDGYNPNRENVQHCIQLCLQNPKWRLSLQYHKLLSVL
jgi:7-carboxy-7-deazaguanine synthase